MATLRWSYHDKVDHRGPSQDLRFAVVSCVSDTDSALHLKHRLTIRYCRAPRTVEMTRPGVVRVVSRHPTPSRPRPRETVVGEWLRRWPRWLVRSWAGSGTCSTSEAWLANLTTHETIEAKKQPRIVPPHPRPDPEKAPRLSWEKREFFVEQRGVTTTAWVARTLLGNVAVQHGGGLRMGGCSLGRCRSHAA